MKETPYYTPEPSSEDDEGEATTEGGYPAVYEPLGCQFVDHDDPIPGDLIEEIGSFFGDQAEITDIGPAEES